MQRSGAPVQFTNPKTELLGSLGWKRAGSPCIQSTSSRLSTSLDNYLRSAFKPPSTFTPPSTFNALSTPCLDDWFLLLRLLYYSQA